MDEQIDKQIDDDEHMKVWQLLTAQPPIGAAHCRGFPPMGLCTWDNDMLKFQSWDNNLVSLHITMNLG